MNIIRSLCVFCGSAPGNDPAYAFKARSLGELLVKKNITLVYGGSNVGIMRILADTVLGLGGKVIGVMPQNLIDREVKHENLTEFHVVQTMHERKALMVKLSDAFIALPGGVGTLDELFEALSWNQLEIMSKPVGILNVSGYYDHLNQFLLHAVEQGFIKAAHHGNLQVDDDEVRLLEKLQLFVPQKVEGGKWIRDLKTDTDERQNGK
jgi:uncharacterized protein (TIGR00730 family)